MTEPDPLFIDPSVDPLLTELREPLGLVCADRTHPARPGLQAFVREVFARAHGARVDSFYPALLGFAGPSCLGAVVGWRAAEGQALFCEHYLDAAAEDRVTALTGHSVDRETLVEVGNLALRDPGQARWVIAATTAFLAAAGYRWVLFTATRPLANAFRRLGLRPVAVGEADPARLPDGGAAWGTYYDQGPAVYAGDILAGDSKLRLSARAGQPRLKSLLDRARALGAESDSGSRRAAAP